MYTFMDLVSISIVFSEKNMGLDTTTLLLKFFTHTLIISILEQSLTTITNTEYSSKQVQPVMVKYITTAFTFCITETQTINKKVITLVDDNIQIKNTEKNNLLKEMGNLSKEEQVANKMLKQLKIQRWATPENLRTYTKEGYVKETTIEASEYANDPGMDDSMDTSYVNIPSDQMLETTEVADDWELYPEEFINEVGDADFDGDYYNVEYTEP